MILDLLRWQYDAFILLLLRILFILYHSMVLRTLGYSSYTISGDCAQQVKKDLSGVQ